jgi:3-dehydroquinate dehydratase I
MPKPRICVTLVENSLEPAKEIESIVDFFEIRLDLVGPDWPELARGLKKPWIACNRSTEEGGKGPADETQRVEELLKAVEAGATIVDLELNTKNLEKFVPLIKARAKCLLSFHNVLETPSADALAEIVKRQIAAGADICKIVTIARKFDDNTLMLELIRQFPGANIVAFAMGEEGKISRILSPLAGGYFTYACMTDGKESAAGQIPVRELSRIYDNIIDIK